MHKVNYNHVLVLVKVIDHGTLGGAAREMGREPSTVWHHLNSLEKALDFKLFEQRGSGGGQRARRFVPTQQATDLADSMRPLLGHVSGIEKPAEPAALKHANPWRKVTTSTAA